MKIRPVVAELFHVEKKVGRTDVMKLIVAVRNFANEPNKRGLELLYHINFKCYVE